MFLRYFNNKQRVVFDTIPELCKKVTLNTKTRLNTGFIEN